LVEETGGGRAVGVMICGGEGFGNPVHVFGATTLDVNEQNPQAVGFYLHQGFRITGRSPLDGLGKPYPLLHLALLVTADEGTAQDG
jgi:hypothetical protein